MPKVECFILGCPVGLKMKDFNEETTGVHAMCRCLLVAGEISAVVLSSVASLRQLIADK